MPKEIPLTHGKVAVVDDDDFAWLCKFTWKAHFSRGRWYARTSIAGKTILMHRMILIHQAIHTDHADGDGLNNRKKNLRPATRAQNGQNRKLQSHSSQYKGVSFVAKRNRFSANIRINGRLKWLGYYEDEREAAEAYDRAALDSFGAYARTNKQIGTL